MQFKTLQGATKRLTKSHKYRINWSGPSRSKLQYRVKKSLEQIWANNIVLEEMLVVGTKLSLDFYNANKKIAIEVQGRQHNEYVPHFHKGNKINFISQLRRDHQKKEFCDINGITLIELYEQDDISSSGIESVIKSNERKH